MHDESTIQAISYITFKPRDHTYSAVFMSNCDDEVRLERGKYDADARRIEFTGRPASASPQRDQRTAGSGIAPWGEKVRVVLEIVSNDEHRVTMYPADQSELGRDKANEFENGAVYVATYTRATGAQADRYRDMIARAGG